MAPRVIDVHAAALLSSRPAGVFRNKRDPSGCVTAATLPRISDDLIQVALREVSGSPLTLTHPLRLPRVPTRMTLWAMRRAGAAYRTTSPTRRSEPNGEPFGAGGPKRTLSVDPFLMIAPMLPPSSATSAHLPSCCKWRSTAREAFRRLSAAEISLPPPWRPPPWLGSRDSGISAATSYWP